MVRLSGKRSLAFGLGLALALAIIITTIGLASYQLSSKHPRPAGNLPTHQTQASNNQPTPTAPAENKPPSPPASELGPVVSHITTQQPVVFLTIDDGISKQSFEPALLKDNTVIASLFLTYNFIKDNPDFFKAFMAGGSQVEDHTIDHKLLTHLSYDEQKQEICGGADLLAQLYVRRPKLFRPPGGSYNEDTKRAAAACGMKAVVLWTATVDKGTVHYQVGTKLRPGNIVLMHFRPEFQQDFQAFIEAEKAAGLHTELLEDWVGY
jgi:peptidoglycan/xylan/chitin deacetylase (PgdA/CDA1 family)